MASDLIGDNSQSENDKEASGEDSPKVRNSNGILSKKFTSKKMLDICIPAVSGLIVFIPGYLLKIFFFFKFSQ